jgi:diguanylate cyclase (GGDEF)-like protein
MNRPAWLHWPRLLSPLESVLIVSLIVGALGAGYYVHATLERVRYRLPAEILEQAEQVHLVIHEVDLLVQTIELARLDPGPARREVVIVHNQLLLDRLLAIRAGYVLDNLLGVAALHALVYPAAEDIRRWLNQGLPGLAIDSPLLIWLVEIRARDAHARTMALFRQANASAARLVREESDRLEQFRASLLLLLAVLTGLALLALHLFLRKQRIETRLAALREQLADAIESIPEGFILCDAEDRIVLCNGPFRQLYACVAAQLQPGTPFVELTRAFLGTGLVSEREQTLDELLAGRMACHHHPGSPFEQELPDGRRLRISERRTRDGGIVGIHADITDIRHTQERLHYLANHDPLTGLVNRGYCRERLEQALARARRHHNQFAVLYLDLDHFKQVNDTLGHHVGDELLRAVARRLKGCLRDEDTLARLGGDEFLILLEDLADVAAAVTAARRLLDALAIPFTLGSNTLSMSTSMGIACYPDHGNHVGELVQHADVAGYWAKSQGPNCYCLYTPDLQEGMSRRIHFSGPLADGDDDGLSSQANPC